ncbi:hypothetical protein D3C87_1262160 [compost metagenome]
MKRRAFIGALIAVPLSTVAAVPMPFDYARGSLEHGVVLDDVSPGGYFYGHDVSDEPTVGEWLMMRSDDRGATWYKAEQNVGADGEPGQ